LDAAWPSKPDWNELDKAVGRNLMAVDFPLSCSVRLRPGAGSTLRLADAVLTASHDDRKLVSQTITVIKTRLALIQKASAGRRASMANLRRTTRAALVCSRLAAPGPGGSSRCEPAGALGRLSSRKIATLAQEITFREL